MITSTPSTLQRSSVASPLSRQAMATSRNAYQCRARCTGFWSEETAVWLSNLDETSTLLATQTGRTFPYDQ